MGVGPIRKRIAALDFRPHAVLAQVSLGCSPLPGKYPTVTDQVATNPQAEACFIVRLACLIHAASVHSEPGSNSPLESCMSKLNSREGEQRAIERYCKVSQNSSPAVRPGERELTHWHIQKILKPLVGGFRSLTASTRFSKNGRRRTLPRHRECSRAEALDQVKSHVRRSRRFSFRREAVESFSLVLEAPGLAQALQVP